MQSDGLDGGGIALGAHPTPTGPAHPDKQENKQKNTAQAQQVEAGARSSLGASVGNGDPALLALVISVEESHARVPMIPELNTHRLKATGADMDEIIDVAASRKGCLTRSESSHEQCRVCQQQTDEVLINLGCRCRGGLANAHLSCIEIWFRTKGSNKCEICQQVAVNVPPPESQTNYWVWRVDPAHRGASTVAQGRERGCFNPLWVAFSILIGGLLLDVLISISLGVSALPVNIIIGVLIVLGLGTALRLALECCHEWSLRRVVQRVETNVDVGHHPTV